jgi:hypothetical protein
MVISPSSTSIYRSKSTIFRLECEGSSIEDFLQNLKEIERELLSLSGTFLWCSDEIMRKVADSDLSLETKVHILPTKDSSYFGIFDSKINQSIVFAEIGIKQPNFRLASTPSENITQNYPNFLETVCKADSGGGGSRMLQVRDIRELDIKLIENSWFPLLIQEYIFGADISVELYYKSGDLILGLCSEFRDIMGKFGPSVIRNYDSTHFEYVKSDLAKIGKHIKIDGWVNATYKKDFRSSEYFLIEFDARPNVWHGAFYDLGIDLRHLYLKNDLEFEIDFQYYKRMYEPERLFESFMQRKDYALAFSCLSGQPMLGSGIPITSEFLIGHQSRISKLRAIVDRIFPIRRLILMYLISIKNDLPLSVRRWIKGSRLRDRLLKMLT